MTSTSALLHQNEPNPFRSKTSIRFSLPFEQSVTLAVFDIQGREVAAPLRHRVLSAGPHVVEFRGEGLPSGVYRCRIRAGDREETRAMVLVR